MSSVRRGWSAELSTEGEAWQPRLLCTNGIANGRKSYIDSFCPSTPTGVVGLGVVRPEIDAPHTDKRAASVKIWAPLTSKGAVS